MDPPKSSNEDDTVFFDALNDFPFHDCTGDDQSEPSGSATTTTTFCNPEAVLGESQNSRPHPPLTISSPATSLWRRQFRRGSTGMSYDSSSIGSESDLFDDARTRLRQQQRNRTHRNFTENEKGDEQSDSNQPQVSSFPAPNAAREANNEESTITTAANDEAAGDSADLSVEPGDSSPNLLETVAGLVIKAIGFQINLFIMFITSQMKFIYHPCMFFIDPYRTYRRGIGFLIWILSRMWDFAYGFISPSTRRWLREHKSIWKVVLRWGWGFLWSIYVCLTLCSLMVLSIIISGFMIKYLTEKPMQKKDILNFDYTKQSPVAYVPVISCGVGGAEDFENGIGVNKVTGARVIPTRSKLQVTVSLVVPESEYNRNLGIFQVGVDFLSSNGKTIAKLSQPCMLKFRSEPIRLLLTFLKTAPLITGYVSETQTLYVKMRGFMERDVPTSCLKVTLEHRAEYRQGAGLPEIYDASLVLESELPFSKRLIWYWKKTIFIWITMSVFIMELLFALVCCRPIIIPRTNQRGGPACSTPKNNLQAQS
ncbi:hypothetical protein L6164_031770 [Bauhinia variegata]|uniref:Uncharacterized protein n=1 Tax=Bauhinia variegata TaxID=167791 RepID=A0ACB9KLK6_BAUVA|nr:hypothetical protein L6164_031770 [Bauhinia variegata]